MKINSLHLYSAYGEAHSCTLAASDNSLTVSIQLNEEETFRVLQLALEIYNARKEQTASIVAKPAGLAIEHRPDLAVKHDDDIPF